MAVDKRDDCILRFGDFRIDPVKRLFFQGDAAIPLMPKAFDTLLYLAENPGRVIDKDELLREVWPETIVEENNLTQNISILRKVFGEKPGEHRFIATVPGRGYKFVAEVRRSPGTELGNTTTADDDKYETNGYKMVATRPGRFWFVTLALASLMGLSSLGFYFWRNTASSEASIRSIAVLPFKPLTIDSRNESMEMGMADSLINKLSASENLIVRPLFSVRRFTALDEDVLAAGRALAVEAVLDGSIQMSADQIRVSARLLRVSDGKQIWAEQFDEDRMDIFRVQDSIAGKVASALNITLSGGKPDSDTTSLEAYESYMLGRLHALRLVMPEIKKGVSYYERAIQIDPNYALAYVGIAEAQRALTLSNDIDPQITYQQAKTAASRAIQLNPDLPESQMAIGMIEFIYEWDWNLAEKHLAKAVEMNPNNAEARIYYAHLLSNTGRHEKALDEARRARELDPVSLRIRSLEGQFLAYAGQNDAALAKLQAAVDLDPNFWLSHHLLSGAYIQKGLYPEAIREADEAKRLSPFQTHSLAYKGVALAASGNSAEARKILDELLTSSRERYVPACNIAMLHAALGENEKALDFLKKGYEEKDVRMAFLKVEPRWNRLRSEPRFIDLVKRMNLE